MTLGPALENASRTGRVRSANVGLLDVRTRKHRLDLDHLQEMCPAMCASASTHLTLREHSAVVTDSGDGWLS